MIIATRLQIKGGSFRELPLTRELADSLEEWFAFLESVKGVRLRTGGIDFAGAPLVFPGRDGGPFGPPVAMERKLALSDLQLFVSFLGLSVQVTLTMMPPVLSVDGNERGTGAQAPTHTRVGEGGMHTGQLAANAQQQHSEEASSNEAMRRDLQCGTCCSCFR